MGLKSVSCPCLLLAFVMSFTWGTMLEWLSPEYWPSSVCVHEWLRELWWQRSGLISPSRGVESLTVEVSKDWPEDQRRVGHKKQNSQGPRRQLLASLLCFLCPKRFTQQCQVSWDRFPLVSKEKEFSIASFFDLFPKLSRGLRHCGIAPLKSRTKTEFAANLF